MWTILQFIKGQYHQPRGFVRFCEVTALETLQPLHKKGLKEYGGPGVPKGID